MLIGEVALICDKPSQVEVEMTGVDHLGELARVCDVYV